MKVVLFLVTDLRTTESSALLSHIHENHRYNKEKLFVIARSKDVPLFKQATRLEDRGCGRITYILTMSTVNGGD
jgi:hypothetical protein